MKKLLLALLVVSSLVSCGKNNSVSSGTTSSSPLTVTGAVESQLGSIIDNNQFGGGQASYYETWNQVITNMPNISYKYGSVSSTSNSSCRTVAYVFQICGSTSYSSSGSTATVTRSVIHSSVDLATKKNELKAIINARSYMQASGSSFYIRTSDGRGFVIDTRYPMQANPVSVQQTNGTAETFLGAYL